MAVEAACNRGVTATVNLKECSRIRAAALVFVDYQNNQIENPKDESDTMDAVGGTEQSARIFGVH